MTTVSYAAPTSQRGGRYAGYARGGLRVAKRWTEAEINYLIQHYPEMKEPDLARSLGRTELSVYIQIKKR